MSSSSTSNSKPPRPIRPLGVGWVALSIVLATLGLNRFIETQVERPPDVVAGKIEPYRNRSPGPHFVVFGACHGDAFIPDIVEREWGTGVKVWNFAYKNTESMEWALMFRRFVEQDPNLMGVAVVFANGELSATANPWEEQTMGLAAWGDVPLLARESCQSFGCAGEVVLRRAWPAYRQRGYLSARWWHLLGVRPPSRGNLPPPNATDAPSWFDDAGDPFVWTKAFLSEAKRRGVPALFIPLPLNPEHPPDRDDHDALAVIEAGGGELLRVEPDPPLTVAEFADDRHLTVAVQPRMAKAIGLAMKRRFPDGGATPRK